MKLKDKDLRQKDAYEDGIYTKEEYASRNAKLQEQIRVCNTTDDALALLKEQDLAKPLLDRTALCVKHWMEIWSGGQIAVEAVTFSTAHQLLGATENWQKAFDAWLETSGRGKDSL